MLEELRVKAKVVGGKQTRRAILDGSAQRVYLAQDADARVTAPSEALCAQRSVPVERVPSMKELGGACGISVGAAVAALLA